MRLSAFALVSAVLVSSCGLAPSSADSDAESAFPEDDPATYEAIYGSSAALSQPGNWVPPVVGAHQRYDDAPAWQSGRNCTGTFTAGAAELKAHLQANYPQISSIGGYSCRQNTADGSKTSVHGTGRALDIMIPTTGGRADNDKGDLIARWLIENAAEVGLQYIIWDRTSYNSSRSGTKYRTYTGPNPHVDHLHVELNLEGANRRTSFYGGTPTPRTTPPTPAKPPRGGAPLLRSPFTSAQSVNSHVSHTRSGSPVDYRCEPLRRSNHKGTDFLVPIGTPVHAAAAGSVIRMNDNCSNSGSLSSRCGGGFGNHVLILHAGGRATLYAHLSPGSGLPRVGATVDCGDRLGLSGNSGGSSGPHFHFEVRDGVSSASDYFSSRPTDPFGGACSSQATSLWAGGAGPAQSCSAMAAGTMPRGDDAAFVGATIPTRQRVVAGQRVRQQWRMRNTGSTTWTHPQYGLARTGGPDFGGPASIGLPEGTNVAPGGTALFVLDATAPMEPGVHAARFRMSQGTTFGASVYLELEVRGTAERGCRSATLGRDVPANSCVQVSYAGCGQTTCSWWQCTNGAWSCASRDGCEDDASFAHDSCASPATCGDKTSCGMCAGADGCVWCAASSTCVDSMAECATRVTTAAACAACLPETRLCSDTAQCCGAGASSAVRCLADYCTDTSMCNVPSRLCAARTDCCLGLACSANAVGGAKECCLRADDDCLSTADCCGEMTCDGGKCTARTPGQSCAATQDCGGSSYCEGSVCR